MNSFLLLLGQLTSLNKMINKTYKIITTSFTTNLGTFQDVPGLSGLNYNANQKYILEIEVYSTGSAGNDVSININYSSNINLEGYTFFNGTNSYYNLNYNNVLNTLIANNGYNNVLTRGAFLLTTTNAGVLNLQIKNLNNTGANVSINQGIISLLNVE